MSEVNLEDWLNRWVKEIEESTEKVFQSKWGNAPKSPPIDSFKASALAELGRRITRRAYKIEEDWAHFTRS